MYSTLSLKRLASLLGVPPVAIFILLATFWHPPESLAAAWSLGKTVVSGWGIFLAIFGSGSGKWAVWRFFWRPVIVQRWFFPDLNGVWEGTTSSNWPVIKAMFDTYEKREKPLHAGSLDQIGLQSDKIELTIKASFFRFRIEGKLANTGGTSKSISARVHWNDADERYELYYIYSQNTPTPIKTDEGMHIGAATLVLDMERMTLTGDYMTKRSWRQGLNTAGLLDLRRISR